MKARVLTALALIPPVLIAFCFSQPWAALALAALGMILCQSEFASIQRIKKFPVSILTLLAIAASALSIASSHALMALYCLGAAEVLGVCAAPLLKGRLAFDLGSLWYAAPLLALPCAHALTSTPGFRLDRPILICLLPLWAGDTAAIFIGKAYGKRRLAPRISPSKTLEGAVGNAVVCVAVAALLGPVLHVNTGTSVIIGVLCAVLGQLGDLFESWLKRQAGLKDSGTLLPGHGGLLDRVDSLLFTAIPSCLALVLLR